ncbi:MAG: site-specific integrase [Candidatus Gracilibacteria bacterium]|jgi:integrase
MKEARAFLEGGEVRKGDRTRHSAIKTVAEAADMWLGICEKEGLSGREPVTKYTYENYEYRAGFIKAYDWSKPLPDLKGPDIVAFRSWLLSGEVSRPVASKVLSSFHSIMKEMTIRGLLAHNPAIGVSVRADSRYQEPVSIPTKQEIIALLSAADRLANSKNKLTETTWRRYRPMLYLAVDSGMRPQEYLAVGKSALRDNGIYVNRAIEGGGSEITVTKTPAGRRFIELSPETLDMVSHYAREHAAKNEFDLIFPTRSGQWQSRRNWQRRGFEAACEEAGLLETVIVDGEKVEQAKYRPYDLRHFFASMLIEKKTNLKKIQALMGHTNIETTLNVYGHLLEDSERDKSGSSGLLSGMLAKTCGESVAGHA